MTSVLNPPPTEVCELRLFYFTRLKLSDGHVLKLKLATSLQSIRILL